jgi:protein-tyrosine-phosphatase
MTGEMLLGADLVIGMARLHIRESVVDQPQVWPRSFTLKELVRRGEEVGPRSAGQPLDEWLEKVHAGRSTSDLLGDSPDDDIFDPIGSNRPRYERTADEIEGLIDRLVTLLFPQEARP